MKKVNDASYAEIIDRLNYLEEANLELTQRVYYLESILCDNYMFLTKDILLSMYYDLINFDTEKEVTSDVLDVWTRFFKSMQLYHFDMLKKERDKFYEDLINFCDLIIKNTKLIDLADRTVFLSFRAFTEAYKQLRQSIFFYLKRSESDFTTNQIIKESTFDLATKIINNA